MAVFYNQATLTYSGGVANSNIVSGEIVEVITASKTATPSTYSAGETVTYVVTLVNSGSTAISGITISDDLGAYTSGALTLVPLDYEAGSVRYFINGVLQPDPTPASTNPLVINGLSVPAGGNATIVYRTVVNGYAPLVAESSINNTVTVSGGGIITPVTANETITTNDSANLTISKAVSPATVNENGQLTYTFVIENSGNTAALATDNVVVSDVFNPALSGVTVTYEGTLWELGTNYTYNEATGEFATTAGQITVPAATYSTDPSGVITVTPGSVTLTVTGTV